MSRIINNKKSFRRYFFIFILCLTGIFLSNTIGYAAPVPVLNYFTCDSSIGSGVANWPTYTYGWTCHASVTMPTDNGTVPKFDLTFKTNDNKATATPGYHGSDVTYTTLNRFRVTYSSAVNMNGATAVV